MKDKILSTKFTVNKIENENFYFKAKNNYSIKQIDIRNSIISGNVNFKTELEKHNFIETAIQNLDFNSNSLEACDFIDCSIEKVIFNNCNMIGAHLNSSIIKDSEFLCCKNVLTNFNKSDFYNVTFKDCDFSRLLIKDCKFYNCNFINCKTTNKIFESCIIFNSVFENMQIQTETIFDNMGLINSKFINVSCRTARITEEFEIIDIDQIDKYATNNLHNLNALFFLNKSNETWYNTLYNFLESDLFYSRKKTSESLMSFLEKLSEFLILLYENNIICLHPILKFHYLTYIWTEKLESSMNTNTHIYKVLIGLHMIHTRYVQNFLTQLYIYFNGEFDSLSLILDEDYVNDKKHYIKKLEYFFRIEESDILDIKPYNSSELILGFDELYKYAPILALILSTRLKVNIENLNQLCLLNSDKEIRINKNHNKLFNLEIGRGKTKDILFALKIQALKPESLMFELSLDLNGKQVFKVYKYIMDFIKNISQKSL